MSSRLSNASPDSQTSARTTIELSPLQKDEEGNIPLIRAILAQDLGEVTKLLSHSSRDEQVTMTNESGMNALMVAAESGHVAAVELLLAQHDISARQTTAVDAKGQNAMMHAAMYGHGEVVRLLLGHKPTADAQTTATDEDGYNALMWATADDWEGVVSLLLAHEPTADAQTSAINHIGRNALIIAARGCSSISELLLAHGSTADAQTTAIDIHGHSALMYAAGGRCKPLIERLLAHQATAERQLCPNTAGLSPLMVAVTRGYGDVVEQLLVAQRKQRPIAAFVEDWWSALSKAAKTGKVTIVKVLMAYAPGNKQEVMQSERGLSVLALAKERNYEDVIAVLGKNE